MKKATMYRQGSGWITSIWDESVQCYRTSHEMPYGMARHAVGEANRRERARAKEAQAKKFLREHFIVIPVTGK